MLLYRFFRPVIPQVNVETDVVVNEGSARAWLFTTLCLRRTAWLV